MSTNLKQSPGGNLYKSYPFLAGLLVFCLLLMIIAFPSRKPMRFIKPPLTYFDEFFEQTELYFFHTLQGDNRHVSPLYKTFCAEPAKAGRQLDLILDAAWYENGYASPLMKIFIHEREAEATLAKLEGMNWEHDPDMALNCLSRPQAIAYGGERADEIQALSESNWDRFHPSLRMHLSYLMARSGPAASRFRKIRRTAEAEALLASLSTSLAESGAQSGRVNPFVELADGALALTDRADLSTAFLSLVYYCDGLDAVLRDLSDSPVRSDRLSAIPGDDWFPKDILYAGQTPFGTVLVGGPGDNIYPAGDAYLIIDLGGNDTYFFDECLDGSKKNGPAQFCSTIIDMDGNDFYQGGEGRVAAGLLGFNTIADLDGDDIYQTPGLGLGAGLLGLGLLVDAGGKDQYMCGSFGMGAGMCGFGLLCDGGGDDTYKSMGYCQGFAGPNGLGVLLEESGDDFYHTYMQNRHLLSEKRDWPAESECSSYSQGCFSAFQKGPYNGIALLVDLAGDDSYRANSLSQGAAQGAGLGMLLDAKGYDFFNGEDQCQGYGAEGGIGLLRDVKGSDHFLARHFAQGMGAAASLGFLIDDEGDDQYTALKGSQGKNLEDGTGMLSDASGRNRFFSLTHP